MGNPAFISIGLPNYTVGISGGEHNVPLGHAGFLLINGNGTARFYEYGLYRRDQFTNINERNTYNQNGSIRSINIEGVLYDSNGNITADSLKSTLNQIFGTSKMYQSDTGMAIASKFPIDQAQHDQVESFIASQINGITEGNITYGIGLFGGNNNDCQQFVFNAASSANIHLTSNQNGSGPAIPFIDTYSVMRNAEENIQYFGPNSWSGEQYNQITPDLYLHYLSPNANMMALVDGVVQYYGTALPNSVRDVTNHLFNRYYNINGAEPANEVYGIGGLPGAGAALNTTPQSTTTPAGTSTSTNTSPETINAQPGGQSSGQLGDSTTTTTAQQPTDGTETPAASTNTSTTETPTTPASTASTDFLVNLSGSQPVAGAPNYSNGVVGSTPASSSGITLTSDLLNEPSLTQQMLAQPVTTSSVRVLPPNAHEGQDQVTPPGSSEGNAMPVSGQDGGDSTSGANAGGGGGVDTLPASGGDDALESQPLAGETTFVIGDQIGVTAGPGPSLGATFAGTVAGSLASTLVGTVDLGSPVISAVVGGAVSGRCELPALAPRRTYRRRGRARRFALAA